METICQMCDQEAHTAMKCAWVYSPCKVQKCDGKRITVESHTDRNPDRIFLTCQYGCRKSWEWLDKAISKWVLSCKGGCLHCWDEHLTKDCPWSGINCRDGNCDGKRYVRTFEDYYKTKKYLLCYACNDSQLLTQAKIEAEASRGAESPRPSITRSSSSPIISETICQMCGEEHLLKNCPWVHSPCKEPKCNGILLIMRPKSGRRYLQCQNGCTNSWQKLDEAILNGASIAKVCFNCWDDDHFKNNCPWDGIKCSDADCKGKRYVIPSGQEKTKGWRFLKCNECGDYRTTLMVAKREAELSSGGESTMKKRKRQVLDSLKQEI